MTRMHDMCRDAVMMAALEDTVSEQARNWSMSQLDFVQNLPRTKDSQSTQAQVEVENAMTTVTTSFETLLKSDQEAWEAFLTKLTAAEDDHAVEKNRNERKYKSKGMDAADSVMHSCLNFEVAARGVEGMRAYMSSFTEIHKALIPKSSNAPGIISIIDCSLMGDALETHINHTAQILLTNKEYACALVLLPWDDNRSIASEYRTACVNKMSYQWAHINTSHIFSNT